VTTDSDFQWLWTLDGRVPKPCADLQEWHAWWSKADRSVAKTIRADVSISTVFLGTCLRGDGQYLFETRVFGGPRSGDGRYSATWEEAEKTHETYVQEYFG